MRAIGIISLLLVACAPDESTVEQALTGKSNVDLKHASAKLALTSFTPWSLTKHGSTNQATSTVTWSVTATQGTTQTGVLVVYGTFTVRNSGSGGAPIGNIIVNLQTRSGNKWVSRSSDIADATQDDAATMAK